MTASAPPVAVDLLQRGEIPLDLVVHDERDPPEPLLQRSGGPRAPPA